MGERKLKALTHHYQKNGAVPVTYYHKGRNGKQVTLKESQIVVRFLLAEARIHALALPGRVPGKCKRH